MSAPKYTPGPRLVGHDKKRKDGLPFGVFAVIGNDEGAREVGRFRVEADASLDHAAPDLAAALAALALQADQYADADSAADADLRAAIVQARLALTKAGLR